jgi:hypothetical protein
VNSSRVMPALQGGAGHAGANLGGDGGQALFAPDAPGIPPSGSGSARIFRQVREQRQDAFRAALEQPDDELVAGGHAKRVC